MLRSLEQRSRCATEQESSPSEAEICWIYPEGDWKSGSRGWISFHHQCTGLFWRNRAFPRPSPVLHLGEVSHTVPGAALLPGILYLGAALSRCSTRIAQVEHLNHNSCHPQVSQPPSSPVLWLPLEPRRTLLSRSLQQLHSFV